MSRSIFGWSLPPGCSMRDIDPPEEPCYVCGQEYDNCICPECPVCGDTGDEYCYINHGLRRTEEQKFLREVMEREWQEENGYWNDYAEDWNDC